MQSHARDLCLKPLEVWDWWDDWMVMGSHGSEAWAGRRTAGSLAAAPFQGLEPCLQLIKESSIEARMQLMDVAWSSC